MKRETEIKGLLSEVKAQPGGQQATPNSRPDRYQANGSIGVIQGRAINSRVTQTINLGHETPPARSAEPQSGKPSAIKRVLLKLADLF